MERFGKPFVEADTLARKYERAGYPNALERACVQIEKEMVANPLLSPEMAIKAVLYTRVSHHWALSGRPSYQVSSPLAAALQKTSLDIDASVVRFPHDAFAVELPLDGPGVIVDQKTGKRLQAIIVGAMSVVFKGSLFYPDKARVVTLDGKQRKFVLSIVQCWEEEEGIMAPCWFSTTLVKGESVQKHVDRAWGAGENIDPSVTHKRVVSLDSVRCQQMVSTAIGVGLFAVGANRKFIERVPEDRATKRRRELSERKGRTPSIDDAEVKRWRVGATINLPRRPEDSEEDHGDHSRELRWSHLRQGHLRMQPVGPKNDRSYILKYIAPTVVRPDLGFPEGYQATPHRLDFPSSK